MQGELARTISQIDEVQSARVMIVLPENRLLLDKNTYPTASVFVHVRGNSQLQPQSINSIRFLVANSVEGLKPNHVSVVDNLGNVLSENTDDDSLTGLTSTQLAARRNLEQYLAKKAQDMLDKVLGPGQAIVRISADINYDTLTRTDEKFDPDGQVVRTQTKNDQNTDSSTTTSSSPVGNFREHDDNDEFGANRQRARQQHAKSHDNFDGRIRNRKNHEQHGASGGRNKATRRFRHRRRAISRHGRRPQSRPAFAGRFEKTAGHRFQRGRH
jgi:flagellar M-ring protein FliF